MTTSETDQYLGFFSTWGLKDTVKYSSNRDIGRKQLATKFIAVQVWTLSVFHTVVAGLHLTLEQWFWQAMMTFTIRSPFRNKQTSSLPTSASSWFSVLGMDISLFTQRLPTRGRKETCLGNPSTTSVPDLVFLVQPCKPQRHWLVSSTGIRHFLSRAPHTFPRPETIDGSHWGENT